jgi:hypothetical protein
MMQGVLHPDGYVRPRADVLFDADDPPSGITAKTAAYTITRTEYGKAFSNLAASGSVTLTLPTPFAGAKAGPFFKPTAQNIVIAAEAGSTINGAANFTNSSTEPYALLELVGYSSTLWIIRNKQGTWA